MKEADPAWVVYLMTIHNKPSGMMSVCQQDEWDAMELARPGYHALVKAGITNEGEAERLARGVSGDSRPRGSKLPRADVVSVDGLEPRTY